MSDNKIKAMLRNILLYSFLAWITWGTVSMAKTTAPLPLDQAFVFSATVNQANVIDAKWHIAPGYYLYRDKLDFAFTPAIKVTMNYPASEFKDDGKNKRRAVFSGDIHIPINVLSHAKILNITVFYQGCSKGGFCYPPVQKKIQVSSHGNQLVIESTKSDNVSTQSGVSFNKLLTNQNNIVALFHTQNLAVVLLVFLGLGLLLSFTPCIFPMIPILTSIIVGHKQPVTHKRAFTLSAMYVLGMSVAYALVGLAVAALGESLQIWLQNPWALSLGGLLFGVLALSMFGLFELRLPRYWHSYVAYWSYEQQGGTFLGVFLMGVLSTLIVSPCVTAPLVGVLLYVAQTGNLFFGASTLFVMGIGMGIPLLIVGMSAGKWLPKSGAWMDIVKKSFGFVMLAMAIWLLSRLFTPVVVNILWTLFILSIAYFVGVYVSKTLNRKKLARTFAMVITIAGVGYMGNATHLFEGLGFIPTYSQTNDESSAGFKIVNSITQINDDLNKGDARPIILDFYADWCESCVSMDKHVFSLPIVQNALAGFTLLRINLSKNTAEDQAILKHFNVIAPPTMLFFDREGREVNDRRIVGEMSATELLSRINVFYAQGCDKKASC